jgi:cytochrome c
VAPAVAWETPDTYRIGKAPTATEIETWNIDVLPDGTGLPPGSGMASQGGAIYSEKCAGCHGFTGSEGPFETLVGRESLASEIKDRKKPKRTIGNLWPYAPVLFDYIRRAMPFTDPGSLTNEEVYSLVGWLLYRNGILPANQTVNAKVLSNVKMPAIGIFIEDPRRPWLIR